MVRRLAALLIALAAGSADAACLLKQSTAATVMLGPYVDRSDGYTEESGLAGAGTELSKAGAAYGAGPVLGTHDSEGWYPISLTTTHTNTLGELTIKGHDSATHLPVWRTCTVVPAMIYDSIVAGTDRLDANVTHVADTSQTARDIGASVLLSSGTGTGQLDFTSGVVKGNVTQFGGSAGTFASGRPEVNTSHIAGSAVSTSSAQIGVNVVNWSGSAVATPTVAGVPEVDLTHIVGSANDTSVAQLGVNVEQVDGDNSAALNAESFFDGTGYDASASTVTAHAANLRTAVGLASANLDTQLAAISGGILLATGTADSGSTTTIVDAALTQSGTDHWDGMVVCPTSGGIAGQCRQIIDFDAATDTLTVSHAWTAAASTNTYVILPGARADLGRVEGVALATHVTGQVPADVRSWSNAAVASPHSSGYPVVTIKDGTGTGEIDTLSGSVVNVDLADTLTTYTGNTPQTGDSYALVNSGSFGLAVIEAQTDDIGAAGAGLTDLGGMSSTMRAQVEAEVDDSVGGGTGTSLTAIPWNASWDAEVQSEVDDGLVAQRLDEIANADSDIDGAAPPTVGSIMHELLTKTTGSFTYDQTTDSLEAIRDNQSAGGGLDAAGVRAAVGLASANLDTQLSAIQADTNLYDTDAEHAAANWGATAASYNTAATMGRKLNDAGSAADPLENPCSDYSGTQVGATICAVSGLTVTVTSPTIVDGSKITIVQGDSYVTPYTSGQVSFSGLTALSASDTLTLYLESGGATVASYAATYDSATACHVDLTATQTAALQPKTYKYTLKQVTSGSLVFTRQYKGDFVVKPSGNP